MSQVVSFSPVMKDGQLDLGHGDLDGTNVEGVGQQTTPGNTNFDDGSNVAQLSSQVNPWEVPTNEPVTAPQVVQAQPQSNPLADEIAHLKKIVGDQGNQIGEYRKLLNTLASQTQPQQQHMGFAPQQAAQRIINTPNPDDYPTARQIEEGVMRVGQVLYESLQSQLQETAAKAQLAAAGITPEEQQLLELQYPGLRTMDANTRAGVVSALAKSKRLETQAFTAANTQATAQVAAQGVRQRVFVEQPQAYTNVPSAGQTVDMDAFGKLNSKQMEEALKKMGVPRVDDWNRRG